MIRKYVMFQNKVHYPDVLGSESENKKNRVFFSLVFFSILIMLAMIVFINAPKSYAAKKEKSEKEEKNVFSPEIGKIVLEAQNAGEKEQWSKLISLLDKAEKKGLSNYEASVVYRLKGQGYYELERYHDAIRNWKKAIDTGKLKHKEILGLRLNIGRLYLANEEYRKGTAELEGWIRAGGKPTENMNMMLAQSYAQIKEFRKSRIYAEKAYRQANPVKRKHFDLLNYIYNQLGLKAEQAKLIEQMIARYPKDKKLWDIWVSLLAQANKDREVFEANKIMYLNGFFTSEKDIMKLASYYSYFDVPYQAAQLIKREMGARRVAKNIKNLKKLMNYLSAAREYKESIPVIQELIRQKPTGKLYRQLGEAYMQLLQYKKAENALKQAINVGGENKNQLWFMIGTSAYQRSDRKAALDAFSKCISNRSCKGWTKFINAEYEAEKAKQKWKLKLAKEECYQTVRRLKDQAALQGVVDDTGRVVVEIPNHCTIYYDQYGNPISSQQKNKQTAEQAEEKKKS